ncbi:MAG: Ig-like domain-containing protein, partial [Lachnospiraceae bacterium]|nr:Ig-like domain-containing protein [Lachnospiraceae bacterium]
MKKRILAVLVSAAMIVADLPVCAMAADTAVAVETEAVEQVEDGTEYDVDDVAVSDVLAKAQAQDSLPFFNGKKQTVTLLSDVAADASENSVKLDPQKQVKKYLNGSYTNFKYQSTNTSVATVDATGVVKAKSAGKAKIKISADTTVKGKTKTVKATVKVVVKKKATKVTPAKEALFLENKY